MNKLLFCALILLLLQSLTIRAASPIGVPAMIEVRKTNGQTQADLRWPADGDRQYDVLTTTNLSGGTWMQATNAPIAPTNLIGAFHYASTNRMQFFRVAKRDTAGPAIISRYPATNGIGVGRFATLTLALSDETGVDTNRSVLTFNGFTFSNGSPGVTVASNSFQFIPGTNAWGDFGTTSAVSFVCVDVLGNTTTSAWTFTLEVQPVVTNVLIHLPPPASFKNAALASAAKKNGAKFNEGLSIISFETNLIVFSYSGTNHGLYTGGILVSHDPARFFYRQITSLVDDTTNHTVTTYTTNLPLTALIKDGTFSPEAFVAVSEANAAPKWTVERGYALPFSYVSEFTVLPIEIGNVRVTPGVLSIDLNGKAEISCVIKNWQVAQFDASISSQLAAEIRSRVEFFAQADLINSSVTLAAIPLAYVVGFIGPVPVWVELQLGLDLGLEVSAEAAVVFETGLDASASSDFRLTWRPAGQTESYSGSFNMVPVPLEMEFQLSAEAFLYLKPRLSALLYSLAGVSADYRRGPDVEAVWNVGDPQCEITLYDKWSINAGLTIVGVPDGQLPSVTLLQEKRTIQTWHWPEMIDDEAPVFTRQPASVTAAAGSTVTLEASATGSPEPNYQWFQNGQAIPFRTQQTLTFTMGNGAVGSYTVQARNRVGWVFSNPATVSFQTQAPPPSGMALIPAGSFTMGDTFSGEGSSAELPLHTVYVSAFYMDKHEVTKALWDDVYNWAITNGYSFEHGAQGKAANHPAHSVTWYDAAKWCNARSEKEGWTPAYYTTYTTYFTNSLDTNAVDQGTAWRAPGFDDSSWQTGIAQFGYGDGDEVTRVEDNATPGYNPADTDRYITYYFRHAFSVTNAAAFTNLTLRLLRDDGGIVYLNGAEIFRSPNMPSGAVNYLTLATANAAEPNAVDTVSFGGSLALIEGTNLLAVEIHQQSATSSDISFDFGLVGNSSTTLIATNGAWKYPDYGSNGLNPIVVIAPYRSGQVLSSVNWSNGYRLPTEAEWEKAARGGSSGRRFPWSDADTITHSQANYYSTNTYAYDTSPTRGYHPTFDDGVSPYTSPVGYFAPNGYGLYDMAGNMREWCWDLYSDTYYSSSPGSDPRGPDFGSLRVVRDGSWSSYVFGCRTADRGDHPPTVWDKRFGFRSVLPAIQ